MLEIIGPIDDAGELVGARHGAARLARGQQTIVGHTESLNGIDGPAQTYCSITTRGPGETWPTSLLLADISPVQLSQRVDLLEVVLKRAMDEPCRQDSGARRCHGL